MQSTYQDMWKEPISLSPVRDIMFPQSQTCSLSPELSLDQILCCSRVVVPMGAEHPILWCITITVEHRYSLQPPPVQTPASFICLYQLCAGKCSQFLVFKQASPQHLLQACSILCNQEMVIAKAPDPLLSGIVARAHQRCQIVCKKSKQPIATLFWQKPSSESFSQHPQRSSRNPRRSSERTQHYLSQLQA